MNLYDELLTWSGNVLNFLILIYVIRVSFTSGNFNFIQTIISVIGLFVSILIHLYTSLKNINEN